MSDATPAYKRATRGSHAQGATAETVPSVTEARREDSGMVLPARCLTAAELEALREQVHEALRDAGLEEARVRLNAALAELAALRGTVGTGYQPPAAWKVVSGDSHAAWLEARHNYLTASDVAAVLGMSPWKSRAQAVREKAFPGPEKASNRRMLMGQFLEEGVAQAFGHFTGRRVVRVRGASGASVLVAHPSIPGLAASLDAVELDAAGEPVAAVEVKVTGDVADYNWTPARVQLQVQMACVGLKVGHVVACAGSAIEWRENERAKAEFRKRLPGVVQAFWDDVRAERDKRR